MMTLTTISEKLSTHQARVFWRTGTKNKGILDVSLDFDTEDAALIGELIAIQYLLFEKQVFEREPGAGNGYKLVVSKGAIKKLALGKSEKAHAQKFAAFLTSRMKGVSLEVSQKYEFMASLDECSPEEIQASKEVYASTFDEVETPAMGKILITRHAVEQYQNRLTSGDPKKPWASLVNRLKNPSLRLQPLSEKVYRHKAKKYGRADNVEVWSHPTSTLHYLFVKENGNRILVTVFARNEY